MATYILVHGAWHGAWCWHRTVAGLRRASHRVIAPDLKSLGVDRTPPGEVTLDLWAAQIAALARSEKEPVVLVGHSRGGIILSEVAERIPDRVRTLVYLTAFLLEDGRSLTDSAAEDPDTLVLPAMVIAADHKTVTMRADAVREAFYGQCSDADAALAEALLVPEPLAPLGTPIHVTGARFGRVDRVYIECARDRAITLPAQRLMQQRLPCRTRLTLDTDHSPFLSRAEELTEALLQTLN